MGIPYLLSPVPRPPRRKRWTKALWVVGVLAVTGSSAYAYTKFQQPSEDDADAQVLTSPTTANLADIATSTSTPPPTAAPTATATATPTPTPTPKPTSTPTARPTATPAPSTTNSSLADLKDDLQAAFATTPGVTWGIYVTDLTSPDSVSINASNVFTAASTTKLFAASTFLSRVDAGTASLSMNLSGYPASWQLQQLINQSNNDSWDAFADYLTWQSIQDYGRSVGSSTFTAVGSNQAAPTDLVNLLTKLYTGNLLSPASSKLLLSYMQNTNEESLLPSGISKGITIYHKYGEYQDNVHDVGILTTGSKTYIVALYSTGNGIYDYPDRTTVFTKVGKLLSQTLLN
jgi:beta-lactamase class A